MTREYSGNTVLDRHLSRVQQLPQSEKYSRCGAEPRESTVGEISR
jgi:hypothetical protein